MPLAPLVSLSFHDFLLFLLSMTIIEPLGNALKLIFIFFQDSLCFMFSVAIMGPLGMTSHYQYSQNLFTF
jgi:hypothetical protein